VTVLTLTQHYNLSVDEMAVHPFESSLFYSSWWETLAAKFPILHHEGQFIKLKKKIFKGFWGLNSLRIAGWNNFYYQNFTEARLDEFLILRNQGGWDYLELVWNTAYTDASAFEVLKFYGYTPMHLPTMPCPVIDIQDGWDVFWQSKSSHYRRDLSKKLKTTAPLEPTLIFFEEPAGMDEFFERFFPLHWEYWEQKTGYSYFREPLEQEFIRLWAEKLRQAGQLQLTGLLMGGELVNLGMNIIFDETLYCILTMNTGLYQDQHPGLVSMHRLIEDACKRGLQKIDLGPGESHYKKKLATEMETCFTMLLANPKSIAGKLYCDWRVRHSATQAGNTAKEAIRG
jgi:hypothetical protein